MPGTHISVTDERVHNAQPQYAASRAAHLNVREMIVRRLESEVNGEDASIRLHCADGTGEAVDEFPVERQLLKAPVNWCRGELIGAGAFGRVYLGLNSDNGELMAVKQVLS